MSTSMQNRHAPLNVLVVNAGSSSLKFTMFRMDHETVLARGIVERIGQNEPFLKFERHNGAVFKEQAYVSSHEEALRLICNRLVDAETGVLQSMDEVEAIGHRVVHGGEKFHDSVTVTEAVKQTIRDCSSLAPLHNPPNLGAIEACERTFKGIPNVAVFDTAFHHGMPPYSYLYAIPYEYYQKYGILSGIVRLVAPDSTLKDMGEGKQAALYNVKIKLTADYVHRGDNHGEIKLGMTGQAEIITEQESLLLILVRKIKKKISLG